MVDVDQSVAIQICDPAFLGSLDGLPINGGRFGFRVISRLLVQDAGRALLVSSNPRRCGGSFSNFGI